MKKFHIVPYIGFIIFLVVVVPSVVLAAPSKNPIFATVEQVQQMISQATQHPKAIRVYDNNDVESGLFMRLSNHVFGFTIFVEQFNRYIRIEQDGFLPQEVNPFFESSNCTGQPYSSLPGSFNIMVNKIFRYAPNEHYIVDLNAIPTTLHVKSALYYSHDNPEIICQPRNEVMNNLYPIEPVDMPFSEPVALPLQFKYQ